MKRKLKDFLSLNNKKGASMVEYAIMLLLIASVSTAIITSIGLTVSNVFNTANTLIASPG
ncbi:MAG: hypothetical protein NTX38_06260 [Methylobacter sp.]|nr:hypothetical protein [Methylobacter sp.]